MKANADKFQGNILPGGRENKADLTGCVDIAFVQKKMFLVCILMENLILRKMSTVFFQKPVPKSLLYSV